MESLSDQPYKTANPLLHERIKGGDQDAITEMITVNMQLVQERVRSYVKRNDDALPLEDDLVSAGYVSLVETINHLAEYDIDNVTAYLTRSLDRALVVADVCDSAIRIDQPTRFKASARGRPIEVRQAPMLFDRHRAKDYRESIHLMTELEHSCRNEVDVEIVRRRVDGYTLKEISEAVDRPYSYVQRTLKEVEKRYDEARQ
jgi:DNA-directed RNA polymerase specialized sigma24 family protein